MKAKEDTKEDAVEKMPKPNGLPVLEVHVDWHNMDMLEAQQWYAKLRHEFETAGSILNARRCSEQENEYVCYMAGKPDACKAGIVRRGRPAGVDSSHKDRNGLLQPVRICSERCWVLYQNEIIMQRRERDLAREKRWHEPTD